VYTRKRPLLRLRSSRLVGQRASGEIQHKDLWPIDLETGAERQLTKAAPNFDIRDFDISPDGRDVVLERVQERSDMVLLDLRLAMIRLQPRGTPRPIEESPKESEVRLGEMPPGAGPADGPITSPFRDQSPSRQTRQGNPKQHVLRDDLLLRIEPTAFSFLRSKMSGSRRREAGETRRRPTLNGSETNHMNTVVAQNAIGETCRKRWQGAGGAENRAPATQESAAAT
jgi:hypothetical protein